VSHTPGPWATFLSPVEFAIDVKTEAGAVVCPVFCPSGDTATGLANARAIAAVPDMVRMLEHAECPECGDGRGTWEPHCGDCDDKGPHKHESHPATEPCTYANCVERRALLTIIRGTP
jgi:hypothetical protein